MESFRSTPLTARHFSHRMARIFISYSRKNKGFCQRLTEALEERGFDFWVDWEDIPPTVDWMKEIEKSIEEAETFLAIVTADWMASRICRNELDIAVKNGKRLIPVVPEEIVWNDVPSSLAQLNFIFFTEEFKFDVQMGLLTTALETDYDWLKIHSRLQVKALEWERGGKDDGFLLRSRDLENAEKQVLVHATKNPPPTDLQGEYILKSRQATNRQNRIRTVSLVSAIAVLLGIIGALVYPSIAEFFAIRQARGELIPLHGGSFYMGATDPVVIAAGERKAWLASLPTFYLEKYEVTNRQYGLCVKHGGCTPPPDLEYFQEKPDYPVLGVDVYQAAFYCAWIGRRLPKELEWIRAARGLDDPRYWPWGDAPPTSELANLPFENTVTPAPQPVTTYAAHPSQEGVVNLVGNALEWTSSYYQPGYYSGSEDYNDTLFWNGRNETYDGNQIFIRLGGGWERPTAYIAEVAPLPGFNTDANTGFRCAAD